MNDKEKNSTKHNNDKNNNLVQKDKKMILVDEKDPVGELPPPFPPRNFKVNEEDDMRDFYNIKKEIGRGRFGTVYLVEDKNTRQKFAAKFVNTKRNQDRANVEREVEIMKTLNSEMPHPRLIQLYDAYDMEKEMCLVLEIVDGGELFERVINDDFVLTERACTVFVRQICEGVEFIHSKNILHLDMKPENILCLSREGNRVKICDFGLARRYDPRKKLQVLFGTPEFVAPEVVNFEPIGFGTDMWSVGVICYVLLSGLSPFMGHNYVETMTNVTHNKYDFEDEAFDSVSDEAKEFIQKLLVLDKSMRPTPAQCLRHPWLRTPPPPKHNPPLLRRFPSSASEGETSDEEDEDDDDENEEDETTEEDEEEEEEEKVVIKVEERIRKREEEEETEKYSVRRRRRKEEEAEKFRKQKEEEEEERKRKEMEAKRKDLERQIEEKKRRIAEEEERCRRIREEEEETRRKEEEEARRRKEEEEKRRREEEEARRKKQEEEAKRRKREQEEAKRKEEEEARRKKEEEARRKKEEEEAMRRKRKEEEARRKKEEEEERRKREEEEVRRKELEAERKRKGEEEVKRRIEEEKRRKEEEEEKKRKEAEEKRRREAEEKRRKEVEEKKRKEAEKRKREAEEKEKAAERRKAEEQKKKKEAEEKKRKEAEERKRKEAKERKRGSEKGERKGELERSKAQLREFVARWNAHPNSPYVMLGDAPRDLDVAKATSGASLTSLAVLPPNDLHPDDLEDEDEAGTGGEDEEFIHYTISAPLKGPASPPQVARHLEERLKQLQRLETTEDRKGAGKSSRKGKGKGSARGEKRRSSSQSPSSRVLQDSEQAESIIQQILNVDHRSAYEEYQRMVGATSGSEHLRRPEVVALQQEEGSAKRRSRNSSPNRHPRRQPSRDVPRDDRPSSREGDRSPAPSHRRPSRDVPLSPSQMERIARAASGGATPQAWPDLIVAPQGEADEEVRQFSLDVPVASLLKSPSGTLRSVPGLKVSPEPEGDAAPTPRPIPAHKGALSLTPPPSPPSENYNKPALSSPSPTNTLKKALAPTSSSPNDCRPSLTPPPSPVPSQDAVAAEDGPSRLVAWILNIGTKTPPRQNSSSSLHDRVTQWEARDGCPRPSASPSPRPSPSTSPSRRPHDHSPLPPQEGSGDRPAPHRRPRPPFSVLSSEDSSTEKVIQTPWGALKRSPSKTSLSKSPSREREASPSGHAKAASPVQTDQVAEKGFVPGKSAAARHQEGMGEWAAGCKSHTLPRSAKLMRQRSMGSVPGGADTAHLEADGSLKRKSKFPPSPNKRPLTPLLFTAQDRISMFEKQQPPTRGPPQPLARTRSSVTLGCNAPNDPRVGDSSQVGFMKTRLLGKARRGAGPALPEEPISPDPGRHPGPDAA